MGVLGLFGPALQMAVTEGATSDLVHDGWLSLQTLTHVPVEAVFMLSGAVALFQSAGRLPHGAVESAMALASTVESAIFGSHATMQQGAERRMHYCFCALTALSAILFFCASLLDMHARLRLCAWASLLVQGLWLLYIALELFDDDALGLFHGTDFADEAAVGRVVPHACVTVLLVSVVFVVAMVSCARRNDLEPDDSRDVQYEDGTKLLQNAPCCEELDQEDGLDGIPCACPSASPRRTIGGL